MDTKLAEKIYATLIKESFLFYGDRPFSDLAKTSIQAAEVFYKEIDLKVQRENDNIPIYDDKFDYGEKMVKVVYKGEVRYIRGLGRMEWQIAMQKTQTVRLNDTVGEVRTFGDLGALK